MHAVTSAGVVHAVTTACSVGNLTDCSCDVNPGGAGQQPAGHVPGVPGGFGDDGWRWGGCSDNVDYGVWFTIRFVDAAERSKIEPQPQPDLRVVDSDKRTRVSDGIRALVNMHNNEVGRKVGYAMIMARFRFHVALCGSGVVRIDPLRFPVSWPNVVQGD